MDLSLTKEQELNAAWVEDKNAISKLQQQDEEQQQPPPQYLNIPDDLNPTIRWVDCCLSSLSKAERSKAAAFK